MTEYAYPQGSRMSGGNSGGMELRDAFAIAAFGSVMGTATNMGSLSADERREMLKAVADMIYEAADIMIEQRKATK